MQAVVDHQMKFTNIYAGWPGCVHDARVLRNSTLYTEAEAGNLVLVDHYILADSAYPLRNWLITPFKKLGNLTPRKSVSTKDCEVHDKLSNVLLAI